MQSIVVIVMQRDLNVHNSSNNNNNSQLIEWLPHIGLWKVSQISLVYKGNWIIKTYGSCSCSINIVSDLLLRKTRTIQLYLINACSWGLLLGVSRVYFKFLVCILIVVYACVKIGVVIAFVIKNSMKSTS